MNTANGIRPRHVTNKNVIRRNTVRMHFFDVNGTMSSCKSDGVVKGAMFPNNEIRCNGDLEAFLGELSMPEWISFEFAVCAWTAEMNTHVGLKLHINESLSIDVAHQWKLPMTVPNAVMKVRRMFREAFEGAIDMHLKRNGVKFHY